jgi:hypothetical protein
MSTVKKILIILAILSLYVIVESIDSNTGLQADQYSRLSLAGCLEDTVPVQPVDAGEAAPISRKSVEASTGRKTPCKFM